MKELLLPCGFDTLKYSWVMGYNWHLYACRELLLPCGFDTLKYSWVKGYNWHLYACRLFCGQEMTTPYIGESR
jgi:hypothetical protein